MQNSDGEKLKLCDFEPIKLFLWKGQRIDLDVNVRTLIIVVICYYCMFQEEKFLLNLNTFSDLYSCLHV